MIRKASLICAAVACAYTVSAQAAVSAEEAKALGTTLTPWGAEKAGNKEGTIPAYEGGVKPPASYDPKHPGIRPDPYAGEKPLFSITAQNMDKYADKLNVGMKESLKKFPGFRIDVYPTHRSVEYPKYVIDNTLKNASVCKTKANGQALDGCHGGFPFPIAKNGHEAMWNHLARYKSYSWGGTFNTVVVGTDGKAVLQAQNTTFQDSPFYDPKLKGPVPDDVAFWRVRTDVTAPARRVGEKLVIIDPVNWVDYGRRAYQYIPGQRRVKLAPDLAYDTPNPQGGGASTMDESQLFLGALDRYDFKLVGKKEMYIPYNTYKVADGKQCPESVSMQKFYVNPDCMRWELHRVWHITATLKPGFRHMYHKRDFYFDEDAPGAGVADSYDAAGTLYRTVYNMMYPMYEGTGIQTDAFIVSDLKTGLYNWQASVADTGGFYAVPPQKDTYYSPEALAAEGVR